MEKQKRAKRIQQKLRHVSRQLALRKRSNGGVPDKTVDQPHRLQKRTAYNCGNPDCHMCANPRKIFKELTIQEKSFQQTYCWSE